MSRKKTTETPVPTEQEATGRLIDVLQSLTAEVATLTQQVGCLTDRAQVLTEAIDDVRQEMEWAIKNMHRPTWAPTQAVTSVSRDPMTEDSAINRTQPKDIPPDGMQVVSSASGRPNAVVQPEDMQGELWE